MAQRVQVVLNVSFWSIPLMTDVAEQLGKQTEVVSNMEGACVYFRNSTDMNIRDVQIVGMTKTEVIE